MRPLPRAAIGLLLLVPLLGADCSGDEAIAYEQLNASTDAVPVEVGSAEELEDATADLNSNTGSELVGQVQVSPGGGPVGTVHAVTVEVGEALVDEVDLVRVKAVAEGRESRLVDLVQDSANEAIWFVELQSFGSDDEVRTDSFQVLLLDDPANPAGSSGDSGG